MKFLLLTLLLTQSLFAQEHHVEMGAKIINIEGKSLLAISLKNDKKWHTYWKNPGDAGLPIKFTFKKNGEAIVLKEFPWPAPQRYIESGNLWAYGYENEYDFFFEVGDALKASSLDISGKWLICKDICIPGSRDITLAINSNLEASSNSKKSFSELTSAFKILPITSTEKSLDIFLSKGTKENQLAIHFSIENIDEELINMQSNILTPYLASPLDYKHEEIYIDKLNKTLYGRIYIDWDGEYEEPTWPLPTDGKLRQKISAKFLLQYPKGSPPKIISKQFKEFSLIGDKSLTNSFKSMHKLGSKDITKTPQKDRGSIWYYLFAAFLGGIILNLMPCVLPVISLKLFGLIAHNDEGPGKILKHNLAYTAGVISTFMVLALFVFILKSSGEQIGWGFQLQSPYFVFGMLAMIFIMALNMLGLFEFSTPGGKSLGGTNVGSGHGGDFFNGVIATILSTPCSAPFLGTALSFAFTTSDSNIFLMFGFIGLGLSFPFILTGIFPVLIKFLPKPGEWMNKLKIILGFTLLLTTIWLYDILSSLIDIDSYGIYILCILFMTFFAFHSRKFISKALWLNVIFFLLPLALLINISMSGAFEVFERSRPQSATSKWGKWSLERLHEAKQAKQAVFINFTATWCLTCKVNKKLVLNTNSFQKYISDNNILLLEADWTKRDDNITQFLLSKNIAGVPAYFVQTPSGELKFLGETISTNKVKNALKN